MLFLEILVSIHCLLFISSRFIRSSWLKKHPSFKLKLIRFLLVSCVLSPLIVHCIKPAERTERLHYFSLDSLQNYVNQPILKTKSLEFAQQSTSTLAIDQISYRQLFYIIFCLLILIRAYRIVSSMKNLRALLKEAVPFRTAGKLVIKVSHHCHIPFSVYLFNKAYILLPISLLSSAKNVSIAIAHEGQHHRNGDCVWAYFTEALRIVFFGNPGITRWCQTLNELQELSCDETLVSRPKISAHEYGLCLLKVVQAVSQYQPHRQEFACTIGMALNKENEDCAFIIRRISMLTKYPLNVSKPLLLGITFVGCSILAPICAAYSTMGMLANPTKKEVDTSHLDPKMQQIATQEIAAAVSKYHAKSGVIAIADPTTGHIIAFAETNNKQANSSWKSRVFSPGSIIKPFIAAAAIDTNSSSESKTYECQSSYRIDGQTFTNYSNDTKTASLTEALSKSINTCFIKVAQDAGPTVIRSKLSEFGFDMTSWWQPNRSDNLQLAEVSVGENIPVTVDSLTKSFAILANKGHRFASNNAAVISEKTAGSVTHMLEKAVQHGTGKLAIIPGVSVAGKTGTVTGKNTAGQTQQLALFAGFTPANAPHYVMLIIIEDGNIRKNDNISATGGALAAPIFHNVVLKSLELTKQ